MKQILWNKKGVRVIYNRYESWYHASHEYYRNYNYSWYEMFVSVPWLVSTVGALTWTSEQDLSKNLLLIELYLRCFDIVFRRPCRSFQAASEISFWRYLRLICETIYHKYKKKKKVWGIFTFHLDSIQNYFTCHGGLLNPTL